MLSKPCIGDLQFSSAQQIRKTPKFLHDRLTKTETCRDMIQTVNNYEQGRPRYENNAWTGGPGGPVK